MQWRVSFFLMFLQMIESMFFDNQENRTIIDRLKEQGIQFQIIEKINPNATNKLSGKTFVVSGVFEKFSRDDLKKYKEEDEFNDKTMDGMEWDNYIRDNMIFAEDV